MYMNKIRFFVTLILSALVVILQGCIDSTGPQDRKWDLVWQDEFEGTTGQLPDSEKWNFDVGTDWGNAQLEYDTDRAKNVSMDGQGNLAIVARKEQYMGNTYTSGRIQTKGILEVQHGRIEARMKLPYGQGMWPAFWMLGDNIDDVGWPECGEIDIMEYRGQETSRVHGSLHGPGYSGGEPVTGYYDLPNNRFDLDFHLFAVEWGKDFIEFYVDDYRYQRIDLEDVPGQWVYDHPFFILLNLAVGGNYVGPPNEQTVFPQTMLIDYVRVYEQK